MEDRRFDPRRQPPAREGYAFPAGLSYGNPVVVRGGQSKPVQNLGWLLQNAAHVQEIHIEPSPSKEWSAVMRATGVHPRSGEFEYRTPWQDASLARKWVQRPRLRHTRIHDALP